MSFDLAGSGRILDAALPQFAERGYENTTLEAVAAAAGVDRPSVELLFPTKASLFGILVNRELDRVRQQVIQAVPTDGSGESVGEAVGRAFADILALVRGHAMSWRLLFHADFGSFGERHAKEELRDVLRTRLRWLVASTVPLGQPERGQVSELLAIMLAAMFEVSVDPLLAGDRVTPPGEVGESLDLLFDAR